MNIPLVPDLHLHVDYYGKLRVTMKGNRVGIYEVVGFKIKASKKDIMHFPFLNMKTVFKNKHIDKNT